MTTPTPIYSPGLEGVIAGETAVSTVEGGLRYRGYPVGELVANTSFEEVAYLLLYGDLPTTKQLTTFQSRLAAARSLPEPLRNLLRGVPANVSWMDTLRSAVSVLSHFDPETSDNSSDANRRKAERLLGQIPVAIAEQYRASKNLPAVKPRSDLGLAAYFLYLLRGTEPRAEDSRAIDASLILYAEHEFNASTFTARVVTSTQADLHSAVVAAIGALKGPLHGGANERVMEFLQAAGSPATAEKWVYEALARKERIMGFGHRVYRTGDVRAGILKEYAHKAAQLTGQMQWEETAEIIENVLAREKNLFPNLDWPAGRLYHALGLENYLYTPMFVMARVAGWCAHIIEQTENNRLIRPRANYIGPDVRAVKPLAERG